MAEQGEWWIPIHLRILDTGADKKEGGWKEREGGEGEILFIRRALTQIAVNRDIFSRRRADSSKAFNTWKMKITPSPPPSFFFSHRLTTFQPEYRYSSPEMERQEDEWFWPGCRPNVWRRKERSFSEEEVVRFIFLNARSYCFRSPMIHRQRLSLFLSRSYSRYSDKFLYIYISNDFIGLMNIISFFPFFFSFLDDTSVTSLSRSFGYESTWNYIYIVHLWRLLRIKIL